MPQSRSIPTEDAAILALIAENPEMPENELNELLTEMSSKEAAEIAQALVDDDSVGNDAILSTARALREWADSNKRHGKAAEGR